MTERSVHRAFDVAMSPDQVWLVAADTQKLNETVFRTAPSTVVARDGEKARIRGTFGALAPEYDEYPWEYEVPRRYHSRRIFTRGVLRRFEFMCALSPQGGGTRVELDAVVEGAPGFVGSAAGRVFARRLDRGLRRIEALLQRQAPRDVFVWPTTHVHADAVRARARPLVSALQGPLSADEQDVLSRIVEYVATGSEPDVARMRPYVLADQWGTPRRVVLSAFLRAAKAGLLRLSWDLLCPSCEAPTSMESLKDLPLGGHCPACDVDFTTDFDRNVEATFRPEPEVRSAERLVFCHGSPSSTPSWLAQFIVPPHSANTLAMRLGAGRYRLLGQGIQRPLLLDVVDDDHGAPEGPDARVHELHVTVTPDGHAYRAPGTTLMAGDCTIVVDNPLASPCRVQLAWRAFASQAATAADVTGVGLFHELFGSDVLSPTQHVDVGRRTILFTDLVGSTALYERVGDAVAYGMVRRHFDLLTAEVEKHGGHVVKTVGDAVMAAFDLPEQGARAGLACIESLRRLRNSDGTPTGLKLRVGVHAGACLAVDANHRVDYFGRTVNVAARIESLGGADELVLSWTVTAADGVDAFLREVRAAGHDAVQDVQRVKGVAEPVSVVRVSVRGGQT